MSIISEQVNELRDCVHRWQNFENVSSSEPFKLLSQAADTIESLSAKLQVANMERPADDCGGWIPCKERLPEEHDSMFADLKGTDKWNDAMFEKISDDVNTTVEYEKGKRKTLTLHTVDGRWKTDRIVKFKVIAWQPLPEEYHG